MANRPLLAEPQQAIYDYLDALLREIPEMIETAAEPEAAVAAPQAQAELQEWDPAALQTEESPGGSGFSRTEETAEDLVSVRLKPDPQPEAVDESDATEWTVTVDPVEPEPEVSVPPVIVEPPPEPEGPPEWARPDFQALLFDVGGLMLAVPLVKLHSVVPWAEQTVTPMPRQPHWCHGLMRYRDLNVRVIDTAALVLPADRQPPESEPPQRILVVGDGRWALSCRGIGDVIRLDSDAVKWRTRQGKRPWLAGTVREQLCALIDTEAFAAMLEAKH